MNLTFKVSMHKEWTLLDDRIIYDGRQILLNDIESAKLISKATFATNGVIQILVDGKAINLSYPNKKREEGERATKYILNSCIKEKSLNQKRIDEIQDEINNLPCKDSWGTRKEISELPKLLHIDEHIKAMTSGFVDGNTWLIVCTNRRVLMLDKGMIYGLELIDIPLDRINSISHTKGLIFGTISITDGAKTRTIENIDKNTVSYFADIVNKEIELFKQSKNTQPTQVVNSVSVADELIKFKQLLDIGVLTQEEFDIKKKELLGI